MAAFLFPSPKLPRRTKPDAWNKKTNENGGSS
jgi:hypothetical protein